MADDEVTRNLNSMDDLDFTAWNGANWHGHSPATTPRTCSSMFTGSLHPRHRGTHRRHEGHGPRHRWDASTDQVPSDQVRIRRLDMRSRRIRERQPDGNRGKVARRRHRIVPGAGARSPVTLVGLRRPSARRAAVRQPRLEHTGCGARITQFGGDRRKPGCAPRPRNRAAAPASAAPPRPTGRQRPAPTSPLMPAPRHKCRAQCRPAARSRPASTRAARRDRAGSCVVHADERATS